MRQAEFYYTREFAKLAGVTVRTLQFYDKEGLLKPSDYTEANHRLYRQEDLLRLQQILTLKYMGFSLDDIRNLLSNPVYEVKASLEIQKDAIDQRIAQLQTVSQALEQTLNTLSILKPVELDWSLVSQMIQGVMAGEKWRWIQRYYTPEQQQKISERQKQLPPQELLKGRADWAKLIEAFRQKREQKQPMDDPAVQLLAGKMEALIESFTQGDEGIRQSLARMYTEMEKLPPEQSPIQDWDTHHYMTQALQLYYNQKGTK